MAKLTKQEIEEIRALRKKGKTLQSIADIYGVPLSMVHNIVKDIPPKRKNNNSKYRCKYCGSKVAKYQTICTTCYEKLPVARELVALLQAIKDGTAIKR
jgi:lipopolysaccharide biosynthesis regulator YciM